MVNEGYKELCLQTGMKDKIKFSCDIISISIMLCINYLWDKFPGFTLFREFSKQRWNHIKIGQSFSISFEVPTNFGLSKIEVTQCDLRNIFDLI